MTGMPDTLTETPQRAPASPDVLSDVLSRVRLSGALFLRGEYEAPWALDSPECADLVGLLAPGARRLILFHIVREGRCWLRAKGVRVELAEGDVAVLPYADRHEMGSPGCGKPVPISQLMPAPPWNGVPVCRIAGGGERSGIVCGYLKGDELLFNPFLRLLPPVFRVRPREGAAMEWMRACIHYMLDEGGAQRAGSANLMARLPELLFVEALRLYGESLPERGTGWLAAMRDPVVGHALSHLHAEPARKWTLQELATRSFSSRSVLDERFRRLLGCSPIRYLTEWRLQVAADLLRTTRLKLGAVAERVGYGSEEAFGRAFRRHVGESPARWRDSSE